MKQHIFRLPAAANATVITVEKLMVWVSPLMENKKKQKMLITSSQNVNKRRKCSVQVPPTGHYPRRHQPQRSVATPGVDLICDNTSSGHRADQTHYSKSFATQITLQIEHPPREAVQEEKKEKRKTDNLMWIVVMMWIQQGSRLSQEISLAQPLKNKAGTLIPTYSQVPNMDPWKIWLLR